MRKPCCDKQDTNKGAWSKQEDQKLIHYIRTHGEGSWRSLSRAAGLHRCGKSCRLRWINYLRPDIKRGSIGEDEEDLILRLHALLGNRWSLIAGRLPGRTDNEVKNYWNTHLRRKLVNSGIDPNNHRLIQSLPPRHQNSDASSSATSSASRTNACHEPVRCRGDNVNDHVSGAASCVDEDASRLLNLNLDLTMTISSPSIYVAEGDKKQSKVPRVLDHDPAPTLLLFR